MYYNKLYLYLIMDGVKRALNDRRMDIREASERARNRDEW